MQIKTEEISLPFLIKKNIRLFVKRIDLNHKYGFGNKYYKLKYNLLEASKQNKNTLLTFGGAFSNHIAATSFFGKENGFQTIGIIRGEEHNPLNPTLKFAQKNGMDIHYISRKNYFQKNKNKFIESLKSKFGDFYFLPEGGTNHLAIKGASEIINKNDNQNFICCAVGTGGTISGIIKSKNINQMKILKVGPIMVIFD